MHLKIPYLHANGQDEEEHEDMQNGMQFSITDIYIFVINIYQYVFTSVSVSQLVLWFRT